MQVRRALDGDLVGDQPEARKNWTLDRHAKVTQWIDKLSAEVMPSCGVSHYEDTVKTMFDTFTRGPRCGALRLFQLPNSKCLGIDVSRAYTFMMQEITKIPVFSIFDRIIPVNGSTTIAETAFYTISVPKTDPILFPLKEDFVPGSVLLLCTFIRN